MVHNQAKNLQTRVKMIYIKVVLVLIVVKDNQTKTEFHSSAKLLDHQSQHFWDMLVWLLAVVRFRNVFLCICLTFSQLILLLVNKFVIDMHFFRSLDERRSCCNRRMGQVRTLMNYK